MADDVKLGTVGRDREVRLWDAPPARAIPDMPPEQAYRGEAGGGRAIKGMLRNISEPTLTVFRPERPNGVGAVVAPGGGWRMLAWEHEGVEVCEWLAARGYTAFLLKYRVSATPPDPEVYAAEEARIASRIGQPTPAAAAPRSLSALINSEGLTLGRQIAHDDGQQALRLARALAPGLGVDPRRIGVMGFSAGAFLAADVALEPGGPPPAFVAPIYGGETGGRPVPADAPPLFTCITQEDRILFKVVEGLYADWSNADRPAEIHIFARGPHGFGMVPQDLPVDRWLDLFAAWLADQGLC